jgi:hypothetical protein
MNTNSSFYLAAREQFPALAEKADRLYFKYWHEQPSEEGAYSWFESVANALNEEMRRDACLAECAGFFNFVARTLSAASDEVKQCIDVSFVENLFWRVPPAKATAYWKILPPPLKALYLGFHAQPPL